MSEEEGKLEQKILKYIFVVTEDAYRDKWRDSDTEITELLDEAFADMPTVMKTGLATQDPILEVIAVRKWVLKWWNK